MKTLKSAYHLYVILFFSFVSGTLMPTIGNAQKILERGNSICAVQVSNEGKILSESQMNVLFDRTNLKVALVSANSSTVFYIDRLSNKVVTTQEILGKKLGFYAFDTSETAKKKIADKTSLVEVDSTKNINGISCRLAILKYDPTLKLKDVRVWYDPTRKLFDRNMGLSIPGIEMIKGIPVLVVAESKGMTSTYTLLSVGEATNIDPQEFKVPSSFVITDLPEFQRTVQRLVGGGIK